MSRDEPRLRVPAGCGLSGLHPESIHHHTGLADGRPEFERFGAVADSLDQRDSAGEHSEVVERLRQLLDERRRAAEAERLPDDAAAMAPEALDRPQVLGYVQ